MDRCGKRDVLVTTDKPTARNSDRFDALSHSHILRAGISLPIALEAGISELEMNDDVETEDFTDELSDDALDREVARTCVSTHGPSCRMRAGGLQVTGR
jgi:hypothetical protein